MVNKQGSRQLSVRSQFKLLMLMFIKIIQVKMLQIIGTLCKISLIMQAKIKWCRAMELTMDNRTQIIFKISIVICKQDSKEES
jgi:hypothetical protein